HLAEQIDTMVSVRLRGLMTMAPLIADPVLARDEARRTFERGRECFEDIQKTGVGEGRFFNILSMGMSSDFEEAIAEGANMVRVGTAIFGEPRSPRPEESDDE
ncbi:MAG: alanine racemase, partial [Dehalococcoidia bacterium]